MLGLTHDNELSPWAIILNDDYSPWAIVFVVLFIIFFLTIAFLVWFGNNPRFKEMATPLKPEGD